MATLPTRDAITNSSTTNAQQKTNLGDQRDFVADLLGTDSSDKAAARAALGVPAAGGTVTIDTGNSIVFEGTTVDANETTIGAIDPTADRAINFPDASGTVALTSNIPAFASSAENAAGTIENKTVDPLGIREAFNATGSAPVFACRAWCNFNGTGTPSIRGSGNIASITDLGVGLYRLNFTSAMPDDDFVVEVTGSPEGGTGNKYYGIPNDASSANITVLSGAGALVDAPIILVSIIR